MDAQTPEEWLAHEDEVCREDRLERLRWQAARMPLCEMVGFPGGWMSKRLFEEARYSYAYGQPLATVVLGLAFVERTLASMLSAAGRSNVARAPIGRLITEAEDLRWLTQEEVGDLRRAQKIRNATAHYRRPFHSESIESRSVTSDRDPDSVVEADARHVLSVVFKLVKVNTY